MFPPVAISAHAPESSASCSPLLALGALPDTLLGPRWHRAPAACLCCPSETSSLVCKEQEEGKGFLAVHHRGHSMHPTRNSSTSQAEENCRKEIPAGSKSISCLALKPFSSNATSGRIAKTTQNKNWFSPRLLLPWYFISAAWGKSEPEQHQAQSKIYLFTGSTPLLSGEVCGPVVHSTAATWFSFKTLSGSFEGLVWSFFFFSPLQNSDSRQTTHACFLWVSLIMSQTSRWHRSSFPHANQELSQLLQAYPW